MQNLQKTQATTKLLYALSCPSMHALPFAFSKNLTGSYKLNARQLTHYINYLHIKNYMPFSTVAKQILKMPPAVLRLCVNTSCLSTLSNSQQILIKKRYLQAYNYIANVYNKFSLNI